MAENNSPLSIVIDADISKLQKAISDVRDSIGQISSAIKKTDFGDFGKGLEQSLSQINTRLDQLEGNLQKTSTSAKAFTTGTKDARTALTSLSLVAQDAPFGFIAIQNNLPNVISSFGELSRGSNGLKGALTQIGSALVGPAGLFLAFSAVTAGVTALVQKYGSLGNAINAIIGNNEQLALTIANVNKGYANYINNLDTLELSIKKSTASEAGKVQTLSILTKTVTDLSKSESVRSNALNQLKDFDKDYYGQFTTATLNADELRAATDKLTRSIIAQAQAKGLENRISKITEQIEELTFAQEQLAPEFTKTSNKVQNSLDQVSKAAQAGGVIVPNFFASKQLENISNQLSEGDKKINKELDGLQKTKEKLEQTLNSIVGVGKQGTGGGKGKVSGIGEIVEGIAGEGVITTNIALFEKYIQAQVRLNNIGVDKMVRYRREQLNALDIMPDKLIKQTGTLGLSLPFGPEAQKNLEQYYNGLFEIDAIYRRFQDAQMSGANQFARLQEEIKQFNTLKDSIESNLTRPFRSFFDDLLENGKVSFDSFVQLAKDAFKRIAAQAIASGLANLLAAVLSGGSSLAIGKLGAAKKISSSLGFLGKTGGLFGSANFSGIGAAPLQMAGAVNLQLRGSDLVASINRTNSTINRIG